jgi:hypothetical protein
MIRSKLARTLIGSTASLAIAGYAAPIDNWEPFSSTLQLPSTVAQSTGLPDNVWLGASNGNVYLTTNGRAAQPTWSRLDSASDGRGGIVDIAPNDVVSSIAPVSSYDSYMAYVTFSNNMAGSKIWLVNTGRGGLTWTNISGRLPSLGQILSVSIGPRTGIVYVATTNGVAYSGDYGATFNAGQAYNDPLTPPSGAVVSATADDAMNDLTVDLSVVGTTNGEVWLANGAKRSFAPQWKKISIAGMPQVLVAKVAIDSRDLTGKTFAVDFNTYDKSTWITRDGGTTWAQTNEAMFQGGIKGSVHTPTFAIAPNTTTMYGMVVGRKGYPLAVRTDDNGTTWFNTTRSSGYNMAVEYKQKAQESGPNGVQIMPVFRIKNLGSVPVSLADKTIEYLFSPEGTASLNWYCDWSPYGCSDVKATFTSYNFTLSLPTNAIVAPGTTSGEIQGRVSKSDWSAFDQTNDYSYIQTAVDWTLNRRVQLRSPSVIMWGSYSF